jgi:hypothetical protein
VGAGMATALVLTGCTTACDLIAVLEQEHAHRTLPFPRVVLPYLGLMCAPNPELGAGEYLNDDSNCYLGAAPGVRSGPGASPGHAPKG